MRLNQAITQQENDDWGAGEFICSKTDSHGIITYANDVFCRVSGYSERELLGQSQNIVRHPDMPCVAFAWCWDMLRFGRDWRGIVKNRCKNGDHYWVDATISPQVNPQGEVSGYFAVRRKPGRDRIDAVEAMYAELCQAEGTWEERQGLSRQAIDTLYRNSPLYSGQPRREASPLQGGEEKDGVIIPFSRRETAWSDAHAHRQAASA